VIKNAGLHHPSNRQQETFKYICSENAETSDIPSNSSKLNYAKYVKYVNTSVWIVDWHTNVNEPILQHLNR